MILAELTTVDPNAIGVAITSLVGCLGSAGAAIAVTYYFLGFLRNEGLKQDRVFREFRDYHAESQKKFQDQLERLADRQSQLAARWEQSHNFAQADLRRLVEVSNLIEGELVKVIRAVEKRLDQS